MRVSSPIVLLAVLASSTHAADSPRNLALEARPSASESQGELAPEKAVDGNRQTRWSAIPGHNQGVWYQLEWNSPVEVAEVLIHQYDRYVIECDVQIRRDKTADWQTVQHVGRPGERLPKVVVCRFAPVKVFGVRIGNITNGPSFTEVEVYERPFAGGIGTYLASDLRGHFVGMVTDRWGSAPVADAEVTLSGKSKRGPWEAKARSNDRGLLFVPMPLGLAGQMTVHTSLGAAQAGAPPVEYQCDAAAFQYGLTPLGQGREITGLSGKWKFSPAPPEGSWHADFKDANWADISVPSHWEMEGFHSDQGVGGYRLRFTPPMGRGRLKLRFEGVYSGAEVWVNGQFLAAHEGGATPFEVDITDVVQKGENVLALRVKEHTTTSDELDHMSHYADFPLAGIFRPVSVICVPEVHLGDLEITTTFDRDYRDAVLSVRVSVLNESPNTFRGELGLTLAGPLPERNGEWKAEPARVEIGPWQRSEVEVSLPVQAPKKWDAEHPNLYLVSARLQSRGQVADEVSLRAGFRQTEIRGSEILINGRPVKLRGTCHHDAHPLLGRAVTAALQRQDLALMKEANLNALRTSHYPPLDNLLDIADELGLYVEDEASFCWVNVSNDLRRTPRILQLTAEMVARDRNHPSVAFWSLCNESEFGYAFERSHEWLRSADPSRPTSAATSASLEIATLHNPLAVSRIDEQEGLKKPLLFDESLCIFQGIFHDVAEMWVDPGVRDYYAQPLPAVFDRFIRSKVTQGSMIWCWADDIFCVPGRGYEYGRGATRSHFLDDAYRVPGRGLVGDAPWGVVDGWRRPKPEFWITKKLHSPVKVKEAPVAVPDPADPIRVPIENQYDFGNLSELKIHWAIGNDRGAVRADVPPRSSGTLEIPPNRTIKDGEILALTFEDSSGRLVDTYRLPLGHEPPHVPPGEKCTPAALKTREEDVLAGPCTTVVGKDFQLAFDRGSGLLRRGVAKGHPLLLELPALHVLPASRPLRPLPDLLTWQLEKLDLREEGGTVRVKVAGRYQDFQGGYEFQIMRAGEISAVSSFQYTGEEFRAREVGLRFSVPRDADVLQWDRRAEWSVYPPDHIGRPCGAARAFSGHPRASPPSWPWAEDDSPMGSNDFRSTKRNIRWAAIHYPAGPGVLIESTGSQHVRAFVENDRISVHVNDWYGGTNAGWWEWTHNYGQGRLVRRGDRIASKASLRIIDGSAPCRGKGP